MWIVNDPYLIAPVVAHHSYLNITAHIFGGAIFRIAALQQVGIHSFDVPHAPVCCNPADIETDVKGLVEVGFLYTCGMWTIVATLFRQPNLLLPMRKKIRSRLLWLALLLFLLMNIMAFSHAYRFTHFSASVKPRTDDTGLSVTDRLRLLVTGVSNPKPALKARPTQAYEVVRLPGKESIECWRIRTDSSRGTVILFHGYTGEKSSLLDKAQIFLGQGLDVMLVDFTGSGGSEGMETTIGFYEAEQVKRCHDYLKAQGEKKIHLFGTSMGAAAVLKAFHDYSITPASVILECPFGSLYKTVCARFRMLGVPTLPMAPLLTFWGGAQHGFWAFGHNPTEYARSVRCPTLLMYGAKDPKVSMEETNAIFTNLAGRKTLRVYPEAGHENFLIQYEKEWAADVQAFLQ